MTNPHAGETTAANPEVLVSEDVAEFGHYADDAPDQSVKTMPPPPVWNPLQAAPPKIHALEVAKAHGVEMAITLRPWSARERLAYEDTAPSLQIAVEGETDDDGDPMMMVRLGSLKLHGAAMTIIGSQGFEQAADGRPFLVGTLEQKKADLLTITDPALFEEIVEAAIRFEPLPGSNLDRQRMDRLRKGPEGVQDPDPSRTPSTPEATATSATDTPESPSE